MVKIHYLYDPMCGWCFGATPLVEIMYEMASVQLVMHPGGMIKRREIDSGFRQMVQSHDQKIALSTGQVFSLAYHERLSGNESIILDSYITAQAIWVMEKHYDKGFLMLKSIQQAHYQSALDTSNPNILAEIAIRLGADKRHWFDWVSAEREHSSNAIQKSHMLMQQWNLQGFPSFIIEKEGKYTRLPHAQFYNNITGWKALIESL